MGWNTNVMAYTQHRAYCLESSWHKSGEDWYGPPRDRESDAEADRLAHWKLHEAVRFAEGEETIIDDT
jgi:hypothetical protein